MAFPTKATHQQTRAHNSALVLRALYDFGPISRADVARLSGLTRTTVGDVVDELIGARPRPRDGPRAVDRRQGADPPRARRRRAPRHRPRPRRAGFHGGHRRPPGQVIAASRAPRRGRWTATRAPEPGLRAHRRARRARPANARWASASARRASSTPTTGTIRWAVNLDWQDLPLGDRVAGNRHGSPSTSPTTAGPRPSRDPAVRRPRSARAPNLVAIKVGRGIGAGIVLDGELFHGDGFGAGEIGHMVVDRDGARVPLRPVRLPRDGRQLAGDRPACDRVRTPAC